MYIAHRNERISIFTLPALTMLFRKAGINIVQSAAGSLSIRNPTRFPNDFFTRGGAFIRSRGPSVGCD